MGIYSHHHKNNNFYAKALITILPLLLQQYKATGVIQEAFQVILVKPDHL